MAAAARAEARRKAILSRGTDRLAKLTTSARGEDAGGYLGHDDPPLPSFAGAAPSAQSFLGEESSNMPAPQPIRGSPSPSPAPRRTSGRTTTSSASASAASPSGSNLFDVLSGGSSSTTPHNPAAWLPEQQQQFMEALLHASSNAGAGGNASLPSLSSPIGDTMGAFDPHAPPLDNPFAALMGLSGAGGPGGSAGGLFPPGFAPGGPGAKFPGMDVPAEPKPKSRLQKALPLLHLVAVWCLLAYFVLWAEPKAFAETRGAVAGKPDEWLDVTGAWKRWAELSQRSGTLKGALKTFTVQVVPFFWAFTTLQIVLHSLRIFAGFDTVQPPALLALALPSLPPPIPSLVINSMKYMQMGSLFLDDLAGLVVGIGFIVYFSGWFGGAL